MAVLQQVAARTSCADLMAPCTPSIVYPDTWHYACSSRENRAYCFTPRETKNQRRRNFIRSRIFRKSSNPRRRDDMQYESLSLSRNFKFVKFFEFRKLIRSFFKFRLLTFDFILLFTRILGCVFYIKNGRVQSHTRFQADRCRTKVKANASLEGWPRGSQSPLFSPRCRVLRLSALPIALRERGQRDLSS